MSDLDLFSPRTIPAWPDAGGLGIEDLAIGMKANSDRVITEADVTLFADLSGDNNPVHLDESYAQRTLFQGRIVHGMFSASLLSAVIANQLPGPGSIYLSQTLTFLAPVRIGDCVSADVTVTDVELDRMRVSLQTVCRVGDRVVLEGSATVLMQKSCPHKSTDCLVTRQVRNDASCAAKPTAG